MTKQSIFFVTSLFFIAVASTMALYLLATEKVIINRPAIIGDMGDLIDENVAEVPAHSLPEVKAGIKKWNEEIKNGKRN